MKIGKSKINYCLFLLTSALFVLLIVEAWLILFLKSKSDFSWHQLISDPDQVNLQAFTGVIRTSGLTKEDKQKVGLSEVDFQLTDLNPNSKPNIHGYFILSDKVGSLLGKCVQIIGVMPDKWDDKNVNDSADYQRFVFQYHRRALIPSKIEKLNYSSCHPYNNLERSGQISLRGTVFSSQRPAPFTNHDYELKLSNTILEQLNLDRSSEDYHLILTPSNNNIWEELDSQMGKEIIIEGFTTPGYEKFIYFIVTSVRPLILNRSIPAPIFPDQIAKTYSFSGIDYALYQKPNLHLPIAKSSATSGILFAHKKDQEWKQFTEIYELSDSSNNPFILDYQAGNFFVLIVDDNGGGSSDGIAKLLTLPSGTTEWHLVSCFNYYYGDPNFDWSLTSSDSLPAVVNDYLKSHPTDSLEPTAPHCADFQLVQY